MKLYNCINCGAILKGNICEYCGTNYNKEKPEAEVLYQDGDQEICITLYGKKLHCYIGEVELDNIFIKDTTTTFQNNFRFRSNKHYVKMTLISKNAIEDEEEEVVSI